MSKKTCPHLNESMNELQEVADFLSSEEEIKCSDCACRGPNLWLCLKKNCLHIGCAEKSNDHSTIHNTKNPNHCIHMNLSTRRIWCYECKWEVFLEQHRMHHHGFVNGYDTNQDEGSTVSLNKDSGHGSYSTLRANSPERGAIFENSVGLNVGMSDVGDASDSSDVGESGDYTIDTNNRGLVGLQNIGNTCYMNAALQALSNTEPLTRYFIECAHIVHILSDGKKPGLSRTYQTLIRDMWVKKTTHGFVTPSGILYGIRNVHAMFRGYHQHDTQEFLRNFMDQLHEELKQSVGPDTTSFTDSDSLSLAGEESNTGHLSYDSSEGEYETCDSGVSERSSLSDDSEVPPNETQWGSTFSGVPNKRRLSQCQSPGRRQRPRVSSQMVIDAQPSASSWQSHLKKQIKHRSIISDIFDGKLLSSVQCLTCDRVSNRVETFQDLSLPIPSRDHLIVLHVTKTGGAIAKISNPLLQSYKVSVLHFCRVGIDGRMADRNYTFSMRLSLLSSIQDDDRSWWYGPTITLHDCLSAFFSTDELKGDNMYSCEKCNKLRNGIKFSKVLQLPEVLCIHLKRFRHELMYSSKISSAISFPLKGLDMWPYLHGNNISKVSNYELFSVICHHGTAGGGHYTSYALNGGQWYEYDDQYVTKVLAERVQNCEAYVLFYRKVQSSAEGVRHKATRIAEEVGSATEKVKRTRISRQWINRFYYCVEPGPIDNSDFLCQHGAFDPDKELVLNHLSIEIPLEMYEYLHKKFEGCPPIAKPVICPTCSALQQRIVNEMESFLEISRKAQSELLPHTHYLSTTWYLQWHAFIQKKKFDPPGPVDNSKINPANVDTDEAADVPRVIWDFFSGIYGGGPEILIATDNDDGGEKQQETDSEIDETQKDKETIEDEVVLGEENGGCNKLSNDITNVMEMENNSVRDFSPSSLENTKKNLSPKDAEVTRKAEGKSSSNIEGTGQKLKNQTTKRGGRHRRRNH